MTLLMGALAGADTFGHMGILGADQAGSLEQLIVDNEMAAYVERVLRGFSVDEDTLALDVIRQVSIGGSLTAFFLTSPGTVWRITESGTWGDASQATAEKGEQFLQWVIEAVLDLLDDIEITSERLPMRAFSS